MTSKSGHVRAGSFCNLGDSGTTAAGTPMECVAYEGNRARWRMKAGATAASRVRKRTPRSPQQRNADKLRPSELNALRSAGALPYVGPLPRQKRQYDKLTGWGFLDSTGALTAAGRAALTRHGVLPEQTAMPIPASTPPAPAPPVVAPAPAEDRSAESGVDWSRCEWCPTCFAQAGRPCHDLRKVGSFNATPHPGRPMAPAPAETPAPPAQTQPSPTRRPVDDQPINVNTIVAGIRAGHNTLHRLQNDWFRTDLSAGRERVLMGAPGDERGAANRHLRNEVKHALADGVLHIEGELTNATRLYVSADTPRPGTPVSPGLPTVESRDPEKRLTLTPDMETVRDAYRKLAGQPGDWVDLADLRDAVPDMPAAAFNQAVKTLARAKDTDIEEQVNQKTLTERDRAAAVHIGGRDQHQMAIHPATAATAPVDRSAESGTDWTLYDSCDTCSAAAAAACLDLRSPGSFNATPHPGRPAVATVSEKPLPDRIGEAYDELTKRPGGPVALADLRDRFPDVPRDELDKALLDMDDKRAIQLEPDPDRAGLTDRDRESALDMVGTDKHLLRKVDRGEEPPSAPAREQVDKDVLDAVRRLSSDDPDGNYPVYVSLRRLRDDLADRYDQGQVDTALRSLQNSGRLDLEPEANQKILTDDDRGAAVHVGGEDRHLAAFVPPLYRGTYDYRRAARAGVDRSRYAGTDWSRYDACGTCGAPAEGACLDLSAEGGLNAYPHPGRPVTVQVGRLAGLGDSASADDIVDQLAPKLAADRSADAGTDWSLYDGCADCSAASGAPCRDLRSPGSFNSVPHPGRAVAWRPVDEYDRPPTPEEIADHRGRCGETVFSSPHAFVDDPEMAARRDYETCGRPADDPIHQLVDPYEEARLAEIAADARRAETLREADAAGDVTTHEPGNACPLGLWHTGPCPAKESATNSKPDPATVRADLAAMTDTADADRYVADLGLSKKDTKALADGLGITVPSNASKEDMARQIVRWTVGRRLASEAIARPNLRDVGSPAPAEDRSAQAGTDWSEFGDCRDCVAGHGQACRDLNHPGSLNATPHPGRERLSTRWPSWAANQRGNDTSTSRPMTDHEAIQTVDLGSKHPALDPAAGGRPAAATPSAEEARAAYDQAAGLSEAQLRALPDDVVNAAVHHPSESYSRDAIVDEAVRRATPVDPAADVVAGHRSAAPELPNGWGTGAGNVCFHDHGATGRGLQEMGSGRFVDVDGEPLANHAGRIATRVVRGQITPDEGFQEMRKLRDRTPDGSAARRGMDAIVESMGCPQTPPPPVPDAVPEPVRNLVRDLHEQFPIVRRDGRETRKLVDICNDWLAGDRRSVGLGLGQRLNTEVRGAHHESDGDRGALAIAKRVTRCVEELEELRRADRMSLYPPRAS